MMLKVSRPRVHDHAMPNYLSVFWLRKSTIVMYRWSCMLRDTQRTQWDTDSFEEQHSISICLSLGLPFQRLLKLKLLHIRSLIPIDVYRQAEKCYPTIATSTTEGKWDVKD